MDKTTAKKLWIKIRGTKKTLAYFYLILEIRQDIYLNNFFIKKKGTETPKTVNKPLNETGRFKYGCPVDKDELGISTWKLLHTMAAVYPKKPTKSQKDDIKTFFGIMSRRYPCDICAKDLANEYDDDNDDVHFNRMVKTKFILFFVFFQVKRRAHCSEFLSWSIAMVMPPT